VRPKLADLLPRQGVPPAIASWEAHAATLARLPDPAHWWFELRLIRCTARSSCASPTRRPPSADSAAVIAVAQASTALLVERFDAGETLDVADTLVIEEDRWLACRHGAAGPLAERVRACWTTSSRWASASGCVAELEHARRLAEHGGPQRQRAALAEGGVRVSRRALADDFLGE
jgi:carboxylate-amine ligase